MNNNNDENFDGKERVCTLKIVKRTYTVRLTLKYKNVKTKTESRVCIEGIFVFFNHFEVFIIFRTSDCFYTNHFDHKY